ncbi:MAG: hypothetical protein QGH20_12345, partial [Candidatus Latescibacteria bacterium]|nr:hypothetical protein [Candidatus Latescibacterota bacterium]
MISRKVSLVCCSHVLCYDFHEHHGIPFVTTGSGGWGICTHMGPGCTMSDPTNRGVFYHFVEAAIEESENISGHVVR